MLGETCCLSCSMCVEPPRSAHETQSDDHLPMPPAAGGRGRRGGRARGRGSGRGRCSTAKDFNHAESVSGAKRKTQKTSLVQTELPFQSTTASPKTAAAGTQGGRSAKSKAKGKSKSKAKGKSCGKSTTETPMESPAEPAPKAPRAAGSFSPLSHALKHMVAKLPGKLLRATKERLRKWPP